MIKLQIYIKPVSQTWCSVNNSDAWIAVGHCQHATEKIFVKQTGLKHSGVWMLSCSSHQFYCKQQACYRTCNEQHYVTEREGERDRERDVSFNDAVNC